MRRMAERDCRRVSSRPGQCESPHGEGRRAQALMCGLFRTGPGPSRKTLYLEASGYNSYVEPNSTHKPKTVPPGTHRGESFHHADGHDAEGEDFGARFEVAAESVVGSCHRHVGVDLDRKSVV